MASRFLLCIATCTTTLLTACASNGWQTETAGPDFPEGIHVLGELTLSATREQVVSGMGLFDGWMDKMLAAGYTDSDISDDSEATVFAYCYGHNSGVPLCSHHGHFIAHIPVHLRQGLVFDSEGDDISGDLVEISLTRNPDGFVVGELVQVYRRSGDWDGCYLADLQHGGLADTLATIGGIGPARALWIECEGLENDGWQRMPVPGAPPSHGLPVSQWFRTGSP